MDSDSQSTQNPEKLPATEAARPTAVSRRKPRQFTTLTRELADFLIEFSIVLA